VSQVVRERGGHRGLGRHYPTCVRQQRGEQGALARPDDGRWIPVGVGDLDWPKHPVAHGTSMYLLVLAAA
jgi:hypothetical protein